MKKGSGLRIVMIGFGNLGRKLAEIVTVERERFPGLSNLDLRAVALLTRSRGALSNPSGISLAEALQEVGRYGRWTPQHPDFTALTGLQAAVQLDYDVLLELSTLSIAAKGEPALSHVLQALQRGRQVVTANKGPSAFAHREIEDLARRRGVLYRHESSVMDGAPVFNMARSALRGCRLLGFSGILNSTTNYLLSRLEEGEDLEAALLTAQRRGFAEADPRHDLEGWDAAAKVCVLANTLMGACLTPAEVERQALSGSTAEAVQKARRAGRRLKLVCRAELVGGRVEGRVRLEEVEEGHPFANISGAANILRLETDLMGPLHIVQQAPTLYDTAYGVLNDLLEIAALQRTTARN